MSEAELSVIADPNPSHPPDEVQPKYDQPWTENTEHELMEIHTKCIQLTGPIGDEPAKMASLGLGEGRLV